MKDGNWEDPSGQIPDGGFSSGLVFCPSWQGSGGYGVGGGVFKTGLTSITHGWPGPSLAVHLSAPSSAEPRQETQGILRALA